MPSPPPSPLSCEVILVLAHLLRRDSLSNESERDALLDAAVTRVKAVDGGAVHVILTGSPRPTFAETNAWLLGDKSSDDEDDCGDGGWKKDGGEDPPPLKSSSGSSSTAATVAESIFEENDGSDDDEKMTDDESSSDDMQFAANPPVQMAPGAGFHSRRSKLLQGTIDRPLWDQRRWTDGETVFTELVQRVGMERFERSDSGDRTGSAPRETFSSALSANLVTIAAGSGGVVEEATAVEIARAMLRFLKRKRSPGVSKISIVLPPSASPSDEMERDEENDLRTKLVSAWSKLEQYCVLVGEGKRMSGVEVVFVRARVQRQNVRGWEVRPPSGESSLIVH